MSLLVGVYETIHTVDSWPRLEHHHKLCVEIWALIKARPWATSGAVFLVDRSASFSEVAPVVLARATDLFSRATLEFTANGRFVTMNLLSNLSDSETSLLKCLNLPSFF
jgi:hypothetical protein